jgi:hypothetical protein
MSTWVPTALREIVALPRPGAFAKGKTVAGKRGIEVQRKIAPGTRAIGQLERGHSGNRRPSGPAAGLKECPRQQKYSAASHVRPRRRT